jgi:F-type H+-transporting ATPase subunit alpha
MDIFNNLEQKLSQIGLAQTKTNVGFIQSVKDGVAMVSGLSDVGYAQIVLVEIDGDNIIEAMVFDLTTDTVGILILGDSMDIKAGQKVIATGEMLSISVSDDILGKTVDALGKTVDGSILNLTNSKEMLVDRIAPGVMARKSVDRPLKTGILVADALVPIGRGQRELIIGDRQTGKTTIALDAILNQKGEDVICVYISIGQKRSRTKQIVELLKERGSMEYTVVVSASASDSVACQYLAPYSGTAIAEYFCEQGKDVLVIYDDLTKQAWAYRQLSLIFRRPPGREAYPGDVFYLHSRLLERSCQLDEKRGGGSITSLPIIETLAGDISAYIPTNVISITDGQIFLDSDLFNSGIRPAISPGLSVSRVGGSAQTKAMKKNAGSLKLDLASYRELAAFSQFGGDLDKATQLKLTRGAALTRVLIQPPFSPLSQADQIIAIFAGNNGFLDNVNIKEIPNFVTNLRVFANNYYAPAMTKLNTGKWLDEDKQVLKSICQDFANQL